MKSLLRACAAVLTGWMLLMPLAAAQETTEPAVVIEDRKFRMRGFAESNPFDSTADTLLIAARASFFRARAEHRAECRDAVRRANKTTVFGTMLACYGKELTALKDFVAQQKTALQSMAGLTTFVRTEAVGRTDKLADAVSAILFAISSGVYDTQDGLLEAKKNLYAKYQMPLWDSWTTVRIDRTLTWVAFEIANIDVLDAQEREKGLHRAELSDARACLVAQETALRPLLKPDVKDRAAQFPGIVTALRGCNQKMKNIPRALSESGSLLQP